MHRYFYPKLGELLNEEVLVGRTPACREQLRPLALSMLAELIHHVRAQLTYPQFVTIIHTFARCVHIPLLHVQGLGRSPSPFPTLQALQAAAGGNHAAPQPLDALGLGFVKKAPGCRNALTAGFRELIRKQPQWGAAGDGCSVMIQNYRLQTNMFESWICRNIHDGELPVTVQCTSVRLMLNLVEVIMQRRANAAPATLEAHRGLLTSILATLSDKLAAVARHTPGLLAEGARIVFLERFCALSNEAIIKTTSPTSLPPLLPHTPGLLAEGAPLTLIISLDFITVIESPS